MKDMVAISNGVPEMHDASVNSAETRKRTIEEQKLKKVCADFESMFVYNLLQAMRKTIPAADPAMQSFGKETYFMMLDQKVAEETSKKGEGLGLQTILFNQLKKNEAEK